jgi:hypothetical protein
MISIDRLKAVRKLIVHKNSGSPCPDGVASALLLRDALPDAEVLFVSHGVELESVKLEEGLLFCDIAPPRGKAEEFLKLGAIVLDHHETEKETVLRFKGRDLGVYADKEQHPGVSGALLAYESVWLPMKQPSKEDRKKYAEPQTTIDDKIARIKRFDEISEIANRFAVLAGVRDTWQKTDPMWEPACMQAAALSFWPWDEWPKDPFVTGIGQMVSMLDIGGVLVEKEKAKADRLAKQALIAKTSFGTTYAVVPTMETSDVAELVEADLLIGFGYHAEVVVGSNSTGFGAEPRDNNVRVRTVMRLSTRSRGGFDCQRWMRMLGGGGHKGAAGAQVRLWQDDEHPYEMIRRLLEDYQAGRAVDEEEANQ